MCPDPSEQNSEQMPESRRGERVTAIIGLVLLIAVVLFQLYDLRWAATRFDRWWEFPAPVFHGEDLAQATLNMERADIWPDRFRSISTAMAARRLAGTRDYTLVVPDDLPLLWSEDPLAESRPGRPGLGDYLGIIAAGKVTIEEYDPLIDDALVEEWRDAGVLIELPWNITLVTGDSDVNEVLRLVTDSERRTIYVVPESEMP